MELFAPYSTQFMIWPCTKTSADTQNLFSFTFRPVCPRTVPFRRPCAALAVGNGITTELLPAKTYLRINGLAPQRAKNKSGIANVFCRSHLGLVFDLMYLVET